MPHFCSNCEEFNATLACSACKYTYYCSPECQLENWKIHKKGCKIQQEINKFEAKQKAEPPKRPAKGKCTGCGVKFSEDYSISEECPDCGYQACECCVSHHSRGTCYCPNTNFGRHYCQMDPAWYHADGRTGASYTSDRHPEPFLTRYPDEVYETEPRACTNCGEVTRVFKKEFCAVGAFR
ncbi:unnamed protein product [Somion occarium]|uniref:MYND-type domain-containing protein n=1 Tax=Somion occarium TaxID=3059160 RepID=A0ABP1EBJ0_9APHY